MWLGNSEFTITFGVNELLNLNEYKISLTKKDKDKAYDNFINNQSHYHALKSNREIKFGDRVLISINSEDKEIQKNLKNYDKLEIEIGSKFQVLPDIDKLSSIT